MDSTLITVFFQVANIAVTIILAGFVYVTKLSLEGIKKDYQKENIAHQIYLAELTKYKFENLTLLLINIKEIVQSLSSTYSSSYVLEYDKTVSKLEEYSKLYTKVQLLIRKESIESLEPFFESLRECISYLMLINIHQKQLEKLDEKRKNGELSEQANKIYNNIFSKKDTFVNEFKDHYNNLSFEYLKVSGIFKEELDITKETFK